MDIFAPIALVAAIGLGGTSPNVIHDRVDMIEVNHFYDENARPIFAQHIFYDWRKINGKPCWTVVAWRLIKGSRVKTPEGEKAWISLRGTYRHDHPIQKQKYMGDFAIAADHFPIRRDRSWVLYIQDNGFFRRITAPIFRETHTQVDPERRNRDILSEKDRRGLTPLPDAAAEPDGGIGAAIETLMGPGTLHAVLRAFATKDQNE